MTQSPDAPREPTDSSAPPKAAACKRRNRPHLRACIGALVLFACSGSGAPPPVYCIHNATETDLLFRVSTAARNGRSAMMEQWISGGEGICDVNRSENDALVYHVFSGTPDIGGCSIEGGGTADMYLTHYGGGGDCQWKEISSGGN